MSIEPQTMHFGPDRRRSRHQRRFFASSISLANSYIANKRPDRAAEKLNLLIEKYPNSPAPKKARELLAQLNNP